RARRAIGRDEGATRRGVDEGCDRDERRDRDKESESTHRRRIYGRGGGVRPGKVPGGPFDGELDGGPFRGVAAGGELAGPAGFGDAAVVAVGARAAAGAQPD